MHHPWKHRSLACFLAAVSNFVGPLASADVVVDWNITTCEILARAGLGTPPANRVMAIVQTAVFEATNTITRRYPASGPHAGTPSAPSAPSAIPGASVDAAVAAATHATLAQLLPAQRAAIDSAYQAALDRIAEGAARSAGVEMGENAAVRILAARALDGASSPEAYRPHTTPGAYVPTALPAVPQWPGRKPWLMTSASQFRPGPPPALASPLWARDYAEIQAIGGKSSSRRSAEQTEIARFWEATLPPIYHGVVRSVAMAPGREVTQNARLLMAVTQAADDALIAVFDAKYHYNFWRPVTAIRNGDLDGNDATARDAAWTPFIDTPMHPEYPCAHCIISSTVGTVLQGEIGAGAVPPLTTTSETAKGAARRWSTIDDFVLEVANARIYDGVHYRTSTEVGTAMGKQVGALAVEKYLGQPASATQ